MAGARDERGAGEPSADAGGSLGLWAGLTGLQRTMLIVAASLMVLGGSLMGLAAVTGSPTKPMASTTSPVETGPGGPDSPSSAFAPRGLLPTQPGAAGAAAEVAEADADQGGTPGLLDDLSPAVFRLGFSFFVGFAIAYAARRFLKVAVIATGAVLLMLFGLQYAEIITVNWPAVEGHYNRFTGWLAAETQSMRAFMTGYLPSTATAAAGMLIGFKTR